ncbi:MAG: hypothetical protein ACR2GP_02640 [Burkholderiaceae bacterium]
MANRTHKTRQKMTFRVAPRIAQIKPRNPLVAPAMKRAAGAHRKSESAARLAEKQALQHELKKETRDD